MRACTVEFETDTSLSLSAKLLSGRTVEIRVMKPGKWQSSATINWPGLGDTTPLDAQVFLRAMQDALDAADRFTKEHSFVCWKREVDKVALEQTGLLTENIPDVDYRSLFDCGTTPEDAVRIAVSEFCKS
jgi:hypothetical protein